MDCKNDFAEFILAAALATEKTILRKQMLVMLFFQNW